MKNYQVKLDDGHDFHFVEVEAPTDEEAKAEARRVARRRYGRIARFWRPIEATELEPDEEK